MFANASPLGAELSFYFIYDRSFNRSICNSLLSQRKIFRNKSSARWQIFFLLYSNVVFTPSPEHRDSSYCYAGFGRTGIYCKLKTCISQMHAIITSLVLYSASSLCSKLLADIFCYFQRHCIIILFQAS